MKQLTPRSKDYNQWYLDVIKAADMAEHSDVKGSMIIKPHGYAIWEAIKDDLNKRIKDTGHKNVYFPLFIPKSYLSKEADHVKGFAKECAVVTHYRLKEAEDGNGVVVDPEAKLEEELIVRPTSETIIHNSFSKWIQSYRDLPLLINQWANVVRWEMRTRFFLRTSEFLWQEGHTAHATYEDAEAETEKMINVYKDFAENILAMPVVVGVKSPAETFPGADHTYTIEAMMQDGKALQAGTSHHLGTNFSKAFNIDYVDANNEKQLAQLTSWGVSTRIVGAMIMTHSDDKGLVLPPKLAPEQVVIVPIFKNEEQKQAILDQVDQIKNDLQEKNIRVLVDTRDHLSPGAKFFEWEKKGIPVRMEIGPRDLEAQQVVYIRRDQEDKQQLAFTDIASKIEEELTQMQADLFNKAKTRLTEQTKTVSSYQELADHFASNNGFVIAHFNGDEKAEAEIKKELGVTTRCMPFDLEHKSGVCIKTGETCDTQYIFAKAY